MPLPGWCTLVRADNPGPMTLDGTNTYVLRGGDVAAGSSSSTRDRCDEEHLRRVAGQGEVALTLLTHGHPDHAEGARRFHELTGAPVRGAATRRTASGPTSRWGQDRRAGAGSVGRAAGC